MSDSSQVKVVIAQRHLQGVSGDLLQRVATVYIGRGEFRIYAPSAAKGPSDQWLSSLTVRYQDEMNSEIEAPENIRSLSLEALRQEFQKQDRRSRREQGALPDGQYCTAQICKQGHVQHCNGVPFDENAHCTKCGSKCIDECVHCQEPIRGAGTYSDTRTYVRPEFCHGCGLPYPWLEERLRTARELLNRDDQLSEEDRIALWEDLKYVMSDPKADLVPAKKKLIEINLSTATGWIRDLIVDMVAKTTAEVIKG